jgi:hypothetical protein
LQRQVLLLRVPGAEEAVAAVVVVVVVAAIAQKTTAIFAIDTLACSLQS